MVDTYGVPVFNTPGDAWSITQFDIHTGTPTQIAFDNPSRALLMIYVPPNGNTIQIGPSSSLTAASGIPIQSLGAAISSPLYVNYFSLALSCQVWAIGGPQTIKVIEIINRNRED